jgi:hypothetical protein
MRMLNKFKKFSLTLSTLAILTFACSCGGAATATPPASATAPVSLTAGPLAPDFTEIDQALKAALTGSIAYNAPQAMKLNETATIELLLNPSVEPGVLATQITQPGEVVTASVEITPRMKAVLLQQSQDAFFIQPLHDNAEQLISTTETTKWSWDVTAKLGGVQRLTLVVYRLITVDGNDNWRVVESYRSDIDVEVGMLQRFLMLDWKWIAGILVTALFIPAFWRWMDQRRKPAEPAPKPKRAPKQQKKKLG